MSAGISEVYDHYLLPQLIQPLHKLAHPLLDLRHLPIKPLPRLTTLLLRGRRPPMRRRLLLRRSIQLSVHVTAVPGLSSEAWTRVASLRLLGVAVVAEAKGLLLLARLVLLLLTRWSGKAGRRVCWRCGRGRRLSLLVARRSRQAWGGQCAWSKGWSLRRVASKLCLSW